MLWVPSPLYGCVLLSFNQPIICCGAYPFLQTGAGVLAKSETDWGPEREVSPRKPRGWLLCSCFVWSSIQTCFKINGLQVTGTLHSPFDVTRCWMKFPRLILPCRALSALLPMVGKGGPGWGQESGEKKCTCLLVGGSLTRSNLFRCAGSMVSFWSWEVWIYSLVLAYRMVGQQICIHNTKCWWRLRQNIWAPAMECLLQVFVILDSQANWHLWMNAI